MLKFYTKRGLPLAAFFFVYLYWAASNVTPPDCTAGITAIAITLLFITTKDTNKRGTVQAGILAVVSMLLSLVLIFLPKQALPMVVQAGPAAFTLWCVVAAVMLGVLLPSIAYLVTAFGGFLKKHPITPRKTF